MQRGEWRLSFLKNRVNLQIRKETSNLLISFALPQGLEPWTP